MPVHHWSIFCRRAVIDQISGSLSIQEVVHQIAVRPFGIDGPDVVVLDHFLVSLWSRSDADTPEEFWVRVSVEMPDGDTAELRTLKGDLTNKFQRTRVVYNVHGIPMRGPGTYNFVNSVSGAENGDFTPVASVPVTLQVQDDSAAIKKSAPQLRLSPKAAREADEP